MATLPTGRLSTYTYEGSDGRSRQYMQNAQTGNIWMRVSTIGVVKHPSVAHSAQFSRDNIAGLDGEVL
jgi:hypothetical protein